MNRLHKCFHVGAAAVVMSLMAFPGFLKQFLHLFISICCVVRTFIFRSAGQSTWQNNVCQQEKERDGGGGESLACTTITDHLELLWQWSSVAYCDSLGDRGVHSGNSSCYQGTQRWQVVLLLESIFYYFNCNNSRGSDGAIFSIIFFSARASKLKLGRFLRGKL